MRSVIEQVREGRKQEFEAIARRYDRVRKWYGDIAPTRRESPVGKWYLETLETGVPEWLVASAVGNAHMTELTNQASGGRNRPPPPDHPGLTVLDSADLSAPALWEIDARNMNAALEISALSILRRYGVVYRRNRGYPQGTAMRVIRGLGFFFLDVEHVGLFDELGGKPAGS